MSDLVRRWWRKLAVLSLVICLFPGGVLATEVGRFTQVEGKVELRKKDKPEAVQVQVKTGAEEKDAIKTEALSRAQLQFLDASTLTVAPLSQITIESYMYDSSKGERGCLSEIARGLVHIVVSKVEKLQKNEFLIKTQTASLGVRGTDFYILIGPDFTDVMVKTGSVSARANQAEMGKINPDSVPSQYVDQLLRQTAIRAAGIKQFLVNAMQGGRIQAGKPLTPPVQLTEANFRTLGALMSTGLPPKLADSTNPGELLQQIQPLVESIPTPPALPPNLGPTTFPGTGGREVASPSS